MVPLMVPMIRASKDMSPTPHEPCLRNERCGEKKRIMKHADQTHSPSSPQLPCQFVPFLISFFALIPMSGRVSESSGGNAESKGKGKGKEREKNKREKKATCFGKSTADDVLNTNK